MTMHGSIEFRNATHADTEALLALVESAYRGDDSRAGWTTEADLLDGRRTGVDDIKACIDRERSVILIAEQVMPGKRGPADSDASLRGPGQVRQPIPGPPMILACAHVAVEPNDGGPDAGYFGMFSVRPTLQGRGVGKALLAEAERIARDHWRLPIMRMTVIDIRDELIAFYERRGYHRTGIHKPFPYGDERFGVPKRDDLRFEVLEKPL